MSDSHKGLCQSAIFKQFQHKLPKLLIVEQYAPKPSMINETECLISISPNSIYKYNLITKKLTKINTTASFRVEEHTNFFYAPRQEFYLFDAIRLIKFSIDFKTNTANKISHQWIAKDIRFGADERPPSGFPCGLISNICTDKICFMAGIVICSFCFVI